MPQKYSDIFGPQHSPSAARAGTDGILKFHNHAVHLQQAAHQPAENVLVTRVCAPGTKGPALK
jgi:hypothetical protein